MKCRSILVVVLCLLGSNVVLRGQSILNTYFNEKGSGTIILSYASKNYTEFWKGPNVMTAPNGGLHQKIVSVYGKYALSDALEISASIPYISNKSDDEVVSDDQVQDISIFLKGKIFDVAGFTGGLSLGTNIATGYDPGSLYSLGNGATTVDGILLLGYQSDIGLSVDLQAGYSIRNGDVPNATLFLTKVGYGIDWIYLDLGVGFQASADGLDIMGPGFTGPVDFPKSKVNYSQLFGCVYVPLSETLGAIGNWGFALSGRNIGKYNYLGLGMGLSW